MIHIVLFLILAVALSMGGVVHLWLGVAVLLCAYMVAPNRELRKLGSLLLRLRWLWISLLVVYLWFTPGQALFTLFPDWSPTYEGLLHGMMSAFA